MTSQPVVALALVGTQGQQLSEDTLFLWLVAPTGAALSIALTEFIVSLTPASGLVVVDVRRLDALNLGLSVVFYAPFEYFI